MIRVKRYVTLLAAKLKKYGSVRIDAKRLRKKKSRKQDQSAEESLRRAEVVA